jgi:ABC-type oligopeptide transport system ATPase subunit
MELNNDFLKIDAISKSINGSLAVDDVSLSFSTQKKIAIIGETGSGKSTFLKLIGGLEQLDAGSIWYNQIKVKGSLEQLIPGHPKIAYLSQHFELPNNYQLFDVLDFINQLSETEKERIHKELLEGNLRFVITVAKQYQNQGLDLGDLIAEGNIGLVGVEGEAAIEYIWKRTARSIKKLQKEHYGPSAKTQNTAKSTTPQFTEANTLNLATDMPTTEVDRRIEDLVSYISQAKKVSDPAKMKYQLTQHVKLHQLLAQKVAANSEHMTWKPYKYQLELYVTAAGAVLPAIEVGGVVRVRIEWSIIEKRSFAPTKPAPPTIKIFLILISFLKYSLVF